MDPFKPLAGLVGAGVLVASVALAQSTEPSAPGNSAEGQSLPPSTADYLHNYWWVALIVLAVVIVIAVRPGIRGRTP